jgi:hypothetical protein
MATPNKNITLLASVRLLNQELGLSLTGGKLLSLLKETKAGFYSQTPDGSALIDRNALLAWANAQPRGLLQSPPPRKPNRVDPSLIDHMIKSGYRRIEGHQMVVSKVDTPNWLSLVQARIRDTTGYTLVFLEDYYRTHLAPRIPVRQSEWLRFPHSYGSITGYIP